MLNRERPLTDTINVGDAIPIDGDMRGTRQFIFDNESVFVLLPDLPEVHKRYFRGKNLGDVITIEQREAISSGTFKELWLGDYWEWDGIKWRIWDFDYWRTTSARPHHLVIMPDPKSLTSGITLNNALKPCRYCVSEQPNPGYFASQIFTETLNSEIYNYLSDRSGLFGGVRISCFMKNGMPYSRLSYGSATLDHSSEPRIPNGQSISLQYLVDKTANPFVSTLNDADVKVLLPTETMIFGHHVLGIESDSTTDLDVVETPSGGGSEPPVPTQLYDTTCDFKDYKTIFAPKQLALASMVPSFVNDTDGAVFWLADEIDRYIVSTWTDGTCQPAAAGWQTNYVCPVFAVSVGSIL